ncbi:hypothetical protein HJC23_008867 [Cyclotella cryptica]|uniref:RAP domain-containing protein n=1 Tax=Cyclotella cryptica TaxID=29204 RepID=A0ABD3P4W3_9STRA|eukprot:CCRYP_017626-RA/>CCRYP_017626-RA protein AED:0.00 eAED:0.00 QI:387/-1/1/1/-1/1/1/191/789
MAVTPRLHRIQAWMQQLRINQPSSTSRVCSVNISRNNIKRIPSFSHKPSVNLSQSFLQPKACSCLIGRGCISKSTVRARHRITHWKPSWISTRSYTTKTWVVKDCKSIEEVLHTAAKLGDELSFSTIAAVWSHLARLLLNDNKRFHNKKCPAPNREEVAQRKLQILSLLQHTTNILNRFRPKALTTITLAMAKITRHVREVKWKTQMGINQQAFAQVFLDDDSHHDEQVFLPFAKAANQILPQYDSRCLSNFAYAYAILGNDPTFDDGSTLFTNITSLTLELLEQQNSFEPQGISNLLWSYATLNLYHSILFQTIGDAVVGLRDLNEFKPQELANAVWAFATIKESHPSLFKKVGHDIVSRRNLKSFAPQALSNIVWAYATLNESHPGLFRKVGDDIVALHDLNSFAPQTFSNSVWAYATANEHHHGLFQKVGDVIVTKDKLRFFNPQELSNTVWSYATLNESHLLLFKKVAEAVVARNDLSAFKPQNLSNIVWAYAAANIQQPELFLKIGMTIVALDDLRSFKPQNLSNIVWAYAANNEPQPELFKKIGETILALDDLKSFAPQNLVNIIWAYAAANQLLPDLFAKIGNFIANPGNYTMFNAQDFANTAWTYTVANVDVPFLFNEAFTKALSKKSSELCVKALVQLYQWHLWRTKEISGEGLPQTLHDRCFQAFVGESDVTSSALQKDVVGELISIGLDPEEEFLSPSGYRLDALVEVNGEKVGLEVEGPHHFIGRNVNGSTMLKYRQVAMIDKIQLVCVPYWEWDALGNDQDKKQQYLRSLLRCEKG